MTLIIAHFVGQIIGQSMHTLKISVIPNRTQQGMNL